MNRSTDRSIDPPQDQSGYLRLLQYICHYPLVLVTLSFICGICSSRIQIPPMADLPPEYIVLAVLVCSLSLLLCSRLFRSSLSQSQANLRRNKVFTQCPLLLPLCLLCLVFLGVGVFHARSHLLSPSGTNHIFNQVKEDSDVVLFGTMISMATQDDRLSRTTLAAHRISFAENPVFVPTNGTVQLRLPGPWPADIHPGDKVLVRTMLSRPRGYLSPGAFDYPRYLAGNDIWLTGQVRSPAHLRKMTESDPPAHQMDTLRQDNAANSHQTDPASIIQRLRTSIAQQLNLAFSEDAPNDTEHGTTAQDSPRSVSIVAGLYRAILLGDRSGLSPETTEMFIASGAFHLLAVSGLHVGILGGLCYGFFYWLLRRSTWIILKLPVKKIAALCTLPIICGYSLLAGMNTPVARASLMALIVLIALCTDRRKHPPTLLAAACLVLLVHQPLSLFTPQFLLSFAAIAAILMLVPLLRPPNSNSLNNARSIRKGKQQRPFRILKQLGFYLYSAALVSVVATLATLPITLTFFYRVSVLGPLSTLLIEPLLCFWSLPIGFLAILLSSLNSLNSISFISPDIFPFGLASEFSLANLLWQLGGSGLKAALYIVRHLAALPHATVYHLPPPGLLILIYYGAMFALLSAKVGKTVRSTALGILVACLATLFWPRNPSTQTELATEQVTVSPAHSTAPHFQVTFLDVGQGSSGFIQLADGTNVLIDGGGSGGQAGYNTIGERVLLPFLAHQKIQKLDQLIITHPDSDHCNGIPALLRLYPPQTIWIRSTKGDARNPLLAEIMAIAKRRNIRIRVPETGEFLYRSEHQSIQCLHNGADREENGTRKMSHNSSLVIKVTDATSPTSGGPFRLIFSGDIEAEEEDDLVKTVPDLKADILLAAHHGSSTSNSEAFLQAVDPRIIVVSAGHKKEYFPGTPLREHCTATGLPLLITRQLGAIRVFRRQENNSPSGTPLYQLSHWRKESERPLVPAAYQQLFSLSSRKTEQLRTQQQ